ncbi:MAG: VTT domain-containing protein [Microbacterium sp.]|uniref:Membrane protein DedA with SNARE-associated domain n=1 Tax=Microbacterium natoriense TaxID=284570 RepID=A0AAW8EYI2_9MICO|nr:MULTISPECIES: VTT domain-containing protein [Microbacterium]MBW8763838.1 VTT domain-containing protein [Microbacterium sp.]MDQ0648490.1 membrane protein DedA with SNARE-associated domain [Microbacterium natoriense]
MDVINELILQTVASPWLYLVLLAVTIIDGFFPPVPSETVLVAAAAVAVSTGDLWMLAPLGLIAALGAVIGDNIAFAIGRRVGTTRFSWMRRPRVKAAFGHAERALDQRSAALILGARYIPVGRVAVNMSAGALGFRWRRFLPLSVLAGISWSALSLVIGLFAGSWIKDQPLLSAAVGIGVALIIGLVIDRVTTARRRRTAAVQMAG